MCVCACGLDVSFSYIPPVKSVFLVYYSFFLGQFLSFSCFCFKWADFPFFCLYIYILISALNDLTSPFSGEPLPKPTERSFGPSTRSQRAESSSVRHSMATRRTRSQRILEHPHGLADETQSLDSVGFSVNTVKKGGTPTQHLHLCLGSFKVAQQNVDQHGTLINGTKD